MEAKKVFKIGKSLHETLNKRKLDIFLNNLGINLDKEEDIRYNRPVSYTHLGSSSVCPSREKYIRLNPLSFAN